jgi:hypothetical protein
VHTRAALLTGHVPVDILIYVEDCCLISVGAEGARVLKTLYYPASGNYDQRIENNCGTF